ncbi:MAG: hypothetical protein A2622_13640 [Bdellovibrionales bacterium RIFCSPHIGHO2_01_FULL_40_29]|nr:MAG: hypothetical protein A2622_13640 [Bdellovibrionales bacterium RIFCSPHIGHO2_01_FULL_40_29]OFZ34262.1 MAG: hypothetical protein A3D17_04310 [Bdellovibrionales bacterium RIFCSPHIGHO2_02_FULL_40_15]
MRFSPLKRNFCALGMAVFISNIPQIVVAETALTMIPTSTVLQNLSVQDAKESVSAFMSRTDVQQQLLERGLSAAEVEQRLAALSPSELNSLASQMNEARAGGDILVTILLVVLIIFLIKRI